MLSSDTMMQRNASSSSMHRSGTFERALSLLLEMFPTMSPTVIEASLRQHQGNLQSCSEALLASQGDDRPDSTRGEAGLASPTDQCWQDEELAMAMQASLDAEAGRAVGPSWLATPVDSGEPAAVAPSLWPDTSGDAFKDLKDAAASVGQTLSEGLSSLTQSLSGWLAAPFGDELYDRQRPGSPSVADRQEPQGAMTHGDTPLHRRAQPSRSSHQQTADEGAREDDDPYDSKKDK